MTYQTYSRQREIAELAETLFERAYSRGQLKAWLAKLTGRPRQVPLLSDVRKRYQQITALPPQRQTIRVEQIMGSQGTLSFDCDFYPLDRHMRDRWVSVAQFLLDDPTSVPAIQAVQVGNEYYVVDGHHRVSVARMLKHLYLDADVTVWKTE